MSTKKPANGLPTVSRLQSRFGRNALHIAVMADEADILEEVLLPRATLAEINARDTLGCTPAVLAAFIFGGNEPEDQQALAALTKAGADLTIADNEGRNVAHWQRVYAEEKKKGAE